LKYKGFSTPTDKSNYTTMINSAVLYALAFNLIFFLQELFLVLGKKALGLNAFLYHNNHTWEGEHPMVSLMQASGALGIFLVGLICLAFFRFTQNFKSIGRLFVLWLAFQGLIQSIPQVMVAYLDSNTDVGEALVGYLKLSQPMLIILAITSITATILISIWFSRLLLEFVSNDVYLNNPKAKFKYIRFIAVGAALIGSILIVPFRIPPISQAITPFIVFVFSVPWTWVAAAVSKPMRRTSNGISEKIYWSPVLFLVLILIFFRSVLAPGVAF
jgi:hypothetical protein